MMNSDAASTLLIWVARSGFGFDAVDRRRVLQRTESGCVSRTCLGWIFLQHCFDWHSLQLQDARISLPARKPNCSLAKYPQIMGLWITVGFFASMSDKP
jgi:hypothetical protein